MISRSDLHRLLASFHREDEPALPTSLSTDCARLLNVSDVTISFVGASDQYTICASSADASSLDEWEFTLEEGPRIDAAATSTSSKTETAQAATNPWPRLSAKAEAIGYHSIAGVPVQVKGNTFATLNLQNRHGAITPETLTDAEQLASEIAALIVAALSQEPPSIAQPADHDKFHQATGMVMSQMGITAEAAVSTLRTHAWTHDRLLTDVANDVVSHTLTFSPPEDERP